MPTDLSFELRGHLMPYERIPLTLDELNHFFVEPFDVNSSRHQLFRGFQNYLNDLQQLVQTDFKVWVDGSFVTKKVNPKDIDLVIILDHKVVQKHFETLMFKFINVKSLKKAGIDVYLVRMFPITHKDHSKYISDSLYWENWFSKSKKNRAQKRYPKGFIEITNFLGNE